MAIKASSGVRQGAVPRRKLTAEEWENIRLGTLNPKTGARQGGLAHPEQNTAGGRNVGPNDWHAMIAAMLGHVGKDCPPAFAKRQKEITGMLAESTRRRNPVAHGRGAWFQALVDLIEVAKCPEGAQDPTQEDITDAGEPDAIAAERAARFSAQGDAIEGKPGVQKLVVDTTSIDGLGYGETLSQ